MSYQNQIQNFALVIDKSDSIQELDTFINIPVRHHKDKYPNDKNESELLPS